MGAQWKAKGKAQAADARGKLFGRLAKDIMIAARNGADPAANSRLRLVVEQARKVSMPKETLERAIKKGAGLLGDAVSFERVIYEGFAPHQVPVMIEVLTDNVNRSASEMRVLFRKGQQGTSGSVSWDFDHVGFIEAEPTQAGADPELAAIEAGAQDFEPADEDGVSVFITEATDLDLVSRALPEHGFTVVSAKLGYKPGRPGQPERRTTRRSRSLFGRHRQQRRRAKRVCGSGGLKPLQGLRVLHATTAHPTSGFSMWAHRA
jgi:YebC/PmpR family DNA-binding regulatory protein